MGTYFPSYELISMVCVFYTGNFTFLSSMSVFISVGIVLDDDATKFTLSNEAPLAISVNVSGFMFTIGSY